MTILFRNKRRKKSRAATSAEGGYIRGILNIDWEENPLFSRGDIPNLSEKREIS
jgi:hypothetical protein